MTRSKDFIVGNITVRTHDLLTVSIMLVGVSVAIGIVAGVVGPDAAAVALGGTTTLGGWLYRQSCKSCGAYLYAVKMGYPEDP